MIHGPFTIEASAQLEELLKLRAIPYKRLRSEDFQKDWVQWRRIPPRGLETSGQNKTMSTIFFVLFAGVVIYLGLLGFGFIGAK